MSSKKKQRPNVQKHQAKAQKKSNKGSIIAIACGALGVIAVVVAIVVLASGGNAPSGNAPVDTAQTYYADIVIEDYGTITVQLDAKSAPITVENFVKLARSGFYDGLTFHRIIEGFMMQGGAAKDGTKTDAIVGEFEANGYHNHLLHTRGAISMARTTDPNSATSQFFIVHQDSPHLNEQYAAFGYVTKGIEIVDAICEAARPTDNNGSIAPADQPVIKTITIRTK